MAKRKPKEPGLAAAIKAVGTARELARRLGISAASISTWKKVPWHRAREIERVTGVHRTVLRPDIFADEQNDDTRGILAPAPIHIAEAVAP